MGDPRSGRPDQRSNEIPCGQAVGADPISHERIARAWETPDPADRIRGRSKFHGGDRGQTLWAVPPQVADPISKVEGDSLR